MKPTQALSRKVTRLALNTKNANKGFYKGTGTGSTGSHTKHGGYVLNWDKVRTYVVPENLKEFKLTPFITKQVRPMKGRFHGSSTGALNGKMYLKKWKEENGQD